MAEANTGRDGSTGAVHYADSLADTRLAQLGFVSTAERAALGRVPVAVRSFAPRQGLIQEGDKPATLYFLAAGWAYRYATVPSGGRLISAILVPGDLCNLDNLMLKRADFGVRALTQIKVLALPRDRALSLAAEHPGIGRAFTWLALAENAILTQRTIGLARRTALQRLAHLLCEIDVRLGDKGRFELPMTQGQVADAIGLTSVHLNRRLSILKLGGLVAVRGRTMTILDAARLRALADFDPSYLDEIEKSAAASPINRPTDTR